MWGGGLRDLRIRNLAQSVIAQRERNMAKPKVLLVGAVLVVAVGWLLAAQSNPEPDARVKWLRVIQAEMELVPRLTRTFQPRPYQTVEVIVGAGEFGMSANESFQRRGAPRGTIMNVRLDTSDPDFLIVATGYVDNVGQWRHRVVHYIAWDEIVDISFENNRI